MQFPPRHLVWLTVAAFTPCAALVVLAVRLMDQDKQLSARRTQEAQERRIEDGRRALLLELEAYSSDRKPAAFRGVLRSGRLILAWDEPRDHSKERGQLEEAVQHNNSATFLKLAALSPDVTDDLAVPIALYAIPRMAPGARARMLRSTATAMLQDPLPYSPAALHLLRSLAQENQLENLWVSLEEPCRNAEAAEQFQAAYTEAGGSDPARWLSWGSPLFLIGFTPERGGSFSFRAVAASQLSTHVSRDVGYLLGDPFPQLHVQLGPAPTLQGGLSRAALGTMLGTAVFLAVLGGLLLWRDFQRERQLAGLRTQFIASVSHELRTPLTAVRMFIESLRMNPDLDADTRTEYLDTMQRESERLSRLVNNVLEFCRIERNTKSYSLHPLSLKRTVASVIAAFRPVIEHAGFQLNTSLDDDVPDLQADADAIEQAIGNLLANAMKYSGSSREIQLHLSRIGRHAQIEVRDFGMGISPAEQAKIFEPYYRVSSKENASVQGAGLGLTVVRHIAKHHGGDVLVESAPGKGSSFRLLLPI
jgi:signal transduction histidine kinase